MHRTVADAVQRLLARLVFANSGARLAFALCKAVAYPAPERFDFLCRSTFAGVLGDAEARSHCILKIDTRGDHGLQARGALSPMRLGQRACCGQ